MYAGKGASPRPVDRSQYGANYDRIFGSKKIIAEDRKGATDYRVHETLFIDARKIGSMISRTQKELDFGDISAQTHFRVAA